MTNPWPQKNSCIVMDNAPIHHRGEIEDLCELFGVRLLYLAPYSPDFNPIEKAFFVIKSRLRRIKALIEIYYSARAQDDLNTEDNPYRKGGAKVGKNPYSDIMTESAATISSHQTAHKPAYSNFNNEANRSRPQSPYGNYRGKRFNPNYKNPDTQKIENKEKIKEKKV